MNQIDLKEVITSGKPEFFEQYPPFISGFVIKLLETILVLPQINNFLKKHGDKKGIEFIDEIFDTINFDYIISNNDRNKIPSEGRVVCVSNHPLGALDGLSLLKTVYDVRKDVKIVANHFLMSLSQIEELLLPFDVYSLGVQKSNIQNIEKALQHEEAVIFFPAAEVSRFGLKGIRDSKWQKGPIWMARKMDAPILPMFVDGKNSFKFYLMSLINKRFSTFLLPREIFRKKNRLIKIKVGNQIPASVFSSPIINDKTQSKLLKNHVYQIGRNKSPIFKTENTIIHPVSKKDIKVELAESIELGKTKDGKKIFLSEYKKSKSVLKEISRLRELTFRKVGEGTGKKCDFDEFDKIYKHIVLWDEEELEIVGSYRLGICKEILKTHGITGIYNNLQFEFPDKFIPFLGQSIEMGRSFIQQKYWNSNALDYLWQGIGAYLSIYDSTRYLYGSVSISGTYNEDAKAMIVYYYNKWFAAKEQLVKPRYPYKIPNSKKLEFSILFEGESAQDDFKILKNSLRNFEVTIPVLLRRYVDLCDKGGVQFLGFGVDKDFANSIDCMILVDLNYLKESFKTRYYSQKSFLKEQPELKKDEPIRIHKIS